MFERLRNLFRQGSNVEEQEPSPISVDDYIVQGDSYYEYSAGTISLTARELQQQIRELNTQRLINYTATEIRERIREEQERAYRDMMIYGSGYMYVASGYPYVHKETPAERELNFTIL